MAPSPQPGVLAVDRSTLIRNMAHGASSRGGVIASLAGQVNVDDSRLDDNRHASAGRRFAEPSRRWSLVQRSQRGGHPATAVCATTVRTGRRLRLGGLTTVADTTVSGNQASTGGGLYVTANARVTVRRGLISGNSIRQNAAAESGHLQRGQICCSRTPGSPAMRGPTRPRNRADSAR